MRETIKKFWLNLLKKLDGKINQWINCENVCSGVVDAGDNTIVNFFLMILRKLVNRSLMGAEYCVVSDSEQAKPLIELCQDLQNNMYKICGNMLGNNVHAECWVVPSYITVGNQPKLIHSYIKGDRICITQTRDDGEIAECYMIINSTKRKNKTYLLCRKHTLEDNGDLNISYFVSDEDGEINANIPEWESIINTEVRYAGVNHIGIGRYKSPVIDYGRDTIYGVPLNSGCEEIEKKLKLAVKYIDKELSLSGKKLFADSRVVRKDTTERGYVIDETIYPVRLSNEAIGDMIKEYCPAIRGSEYESHLISLLEKYQALMGVQDIITHNNTTHGATATEIKFANIDNKMMEQSVRKAIRRGNIDTITADSIYLGISKDLWEYDEEYEDIYQDEQQVLKSYIELYNIGAVELKDIIKYWFPTYSDKQIEEKINAIKSEQANNTQKSIEELLNT